MNDERTDGSVSCELVCENLSAIHDGETLTLNHGVVTEHVNGCASCKAYQIYLPRMVNVMRREIPVSADLDQLWGNILSEIDKDLKEPRYLSPTLIPLKISSGRKKFQKWLSSFSIAASLLVGVLVGSLLVSMPEDLHSAALVTEIIRDFDKFENQGGIFDKAELDKGSSVEWIAEKVDFDLPAALKKPSGYEPAGSRLCSLAGKSIAFIQYIKNQQDTLSLYVWEGEQIDLPEGGARLTGHTPGGLTTVAWKEGDIAYVIISELPVESINSLFRHTGSEVSRSL